MKIIDPEYQKTTIIFPTNESGVLLGFKKRGFGEGWWNGFGGKLDKGESYEDSARRETFEEVGIHIGNLSLVANLHFYFDDVLGVVSKAYTATYSDTPQETDEMRPKLFSYDHLPFDEMWPADRLWVPKVLNKTYLSSPLGFIVHFSGNKSFKTIEEVSTDQLEDKY